MNITKFTAQLDLADLFLKIGHKKSNDFLKISIEISS